MKMFVFLAITQLHFIVENINGAVFKLHIIQYFDALYNFYLRCYSQNTI